MDTQQVTNWEKDAIQFREDLDLGVFSRRHDLQDWEAWFAPYDDAIYKFVVERLHPDDVLLDIGAGDFRLAAAAAPRVKRVYAIEVFPELVATFLQQAGTELPRNLQVICANALDFPFPADVTVGVLLMRHCQHFATYYQKLTSIGAQRLFTNARWHMDSEEIDLTLKRFDFDKAPDGWYACACGTVGYKESSTDNNIPAAGAIHEVKNCPHCLATKEIHKW